MAETVGLRSAAREDLAPLTELWFRSAREAFLPLLPEGFVLPDASRLDGASGSLEEERTAVVVADEGDAILGFVAAGPYRDSDLPGPVGEIWSLFLDPRAMGRGVGRRLLEAGLDHLRRIGLGEVVLWSFRGNERANAFYERHGFSRDGAEKRMADWDEIPIDRYRLTMSAQ